MNALKKRNNVIVAAVLLAFALFACAGGMSAHADIGPKPSVIVSVENPGGKLCYGTLLSETASAGPAYAYTPDIPYISPEYDPESEYYDEDEHAVWKAFTEYSDPDGYYYLQRHWTCGETGKISWTYYPPDKFKILLYFPETQTFATSGIYESYAFHSYFTATLSSFGVTVSQTETLDVRRSYDYSLEILSLLVRIAATVLIETGIAYLFKLRTKREIVAVVIVNAITQTVMNVALNVLAFFMGGWAMLWYIPIELAVFVAEAAAYGIIFRRMQIKAASTDGGGFCCGYPSVGKSVALSFVSNAASFAVGFVLMYFMPSLF